MRSFIAWGVLGVAILSWGGFAFFVHTLNTARVAYADSAAIYEAESLRGEGATRLRAIVRDSEAERAALESIVRISLLDAAETIEAAGRTAGATNVSIGEASPGSSSASQKLSTYTFVVNAQGSFASLTRAVSLLEALPLPALVEQFEISKTDTTWRLTARLRTTLASQK